MDWLQHLLGAAISSRTSEYEDNLNSQDHRAFLFMFASCILHEIGHVSDTYLTRIRKARRANYELAFSSTWPLERCFQ